MYRNANDPVKGKNLQDELSERRENITSAIKREIANADKYLKLDKSNYIESLESRSRLSMPVVHFVEIKNDFGELDNPQYDRLFNRRQKLQTIIYSLTYEDTCGLLRYCLPYSVSTTVGSTEINMRRSLLLSFEIIDFNGDDQIKNDRQLVISTLKGSLNSASTSIEQYNSQLRNFIDQVLDTHGQQVVKDKKRLDDLLE
jgi:hypothetical protein